MDGFKIQMPDPDGETYDDGTRDLLIEGEWPASLSGDRAKVTLTVDGVEADLDEAMLRWLVVTGGPALLAKLHEAAR